MKNATFRNHLGFWAVAFIAVAGAASCGEDEHGHAGGATGSVCPSGSTLTYDSFGRNFMQTYCTRCHASTVTGDMRQGAPADHNFDTFAGIFRFADHIDAHAAAGPNSVNTDMPPSDPKPSEEDRRKLGQWLACETSDGDAGGGDGGTGDGGSRGDTGGTPDMGNRDTASSDGRSGG